MPSKLDPLTVERIQDLLRQKLSPQEVAKEVGCSERIVYKFRRNLRYFDSVRAPPASQGRSPKLTATIWEGLVDFFAEYSAFHKSVQNTKKS